MSANNLLDVRRVPPRNRLKREDRLARWNNEAVQGQALRPKRADGKNARYSWIESLYEATELSPTVRHVGMVLALAGNTDGSNIFPGVRTIADRCNLSQRAVSKSISALVCGGRLQRKYRNGRAGPGAGFEYVLMVPTVLTLHQHLVLMQRQHTGGNVLTHDQHPEQVLTDGQHGADPGAQGADANDSKVLTQGQRTSPSTYPKTSADETPAAPADLAKARRARSNRESTNVSAEPIEERIRKARKIIGCMPEIDDDKLAIMCKLDSDALRKVRTV